jgi:hypothetical protein
MRVPNRLVVISSLVMVIAIAVLSWPEDEWVPEPIRGIQMQCFNESKPLPWSFCINRAPGNNSQNLIYYFHGRNGSATWWNDETYYSGEVEKLWKTEGLSHPIVVSISFGRQWLLTEAENGLLPIFMNQVMPRVEAEVGRPIARRLAVGESMGGINALVIGLKASGKFSKVAALCPPLPTVSPNSSFAEMASYIRLTSTSWRRAGMMLWFSRKFSPTDSVWLDSNPVPLSRQFNGSSGVQFYLSCGLKDEWGCQEGAESVVKNIQRRGGKVEWHLMPGGHCDIDSRSLALFLADRS